MSKDILQEFARLESRQNFVVAVEEILSSTKTKRSVDFDTLVSLEKKHPRMVSTVVSDFRNGSLAFEELSAVKKGLIGAGLFAIIAMILRFLGVGSGGGSGGSGGGGGGGASTSSVKMQALNNTISEVKKSEEVIEEIQETLDEDEDDIADIIDEWIDDMLSDDDPEVADSEKGQIIQDIYDVGGASGDKLHEDDIKHTPFKQKMEAVKRVKITSDTLYRSMAIRVLRSVNIAPLWLETGELSLLKNVVIGNVRSTAEISDLTCEEFIDEITQYMDHCHHCFENVNEKMRDNARALFDEDYPSNDFPVFKIGKSLETFIHNIDHISNPSEYGTAAVKSNAPSYINHQSSIAVDKYTALLHLKMSDADIQTFVNNKSLVELSDIITNRCNEAAGVYSALVSVFTKMNDPALEVIDDEINNIHGYWGGETHYPLAMHKLFKEYKQIEMFCKNIFKLMLLVDNTFAHIRHAGDKYSRTLKNQRNLLNRINKNR